MAAEERASILVADDDPAVRDAISHSLRAERYAVETAADGDAALTAILSDDFDLAIMNVMMPRMFGTDVCRTLRAENDLPIILLSARDSTIDRVIGLELGADGYVTKPFSMAELISRVRALLRRRQLDLRGLTQIHQVGDLHIDLTRGRVTVGGEPVALTDSEIRLLTLLAEEPGRVYTRGEIMEYLWEGAYAGDERAVDIHVSNVRRKIERDPSHPKRLLTVRGVGYKLFPPLRAPLVDGAAPEEV